MVLYGTHYKYTTLLYGAQYYTTVLYCTSHTTTIFMMSLNLTLSMLKYSCALIGSYWAYGRRQVSDTQCLFIVFIVLFSYLINCYYYCNYVLQIGVLMWRSLVVWRCVWWWASLVCCTRTRDGGKCSSTQSPMVGFIVVTVTVLVGLIACMLIFHGFFVGFIKLDLCVFRGVFWPGHL